MDIQDSDVFMVGSIDVPSDSIEEAMDAAAAHLGYRLAGLPDGEVSLRQAWAPGVASVALRDHPELELVGPESGITIRQTPLGPVGSHQSKERGHAREDQRRPNELLDDLRKDADRLAAERTAR